MLNSMTGFARETADTPFGTLTCELRTVNHRYLDVQFRLPEELRPKEIAFRQQIAAGVRRGKVECSVHLLRTGGRNDELTLNGELVRQLGARLDEISTLLPQAGKLDPIAVLRWPGVVQEPEFDAEPLLAAAADLLDTTLAALRKMRWREGARTTQ